MKSSQSLKCENCGSLYRKNYFADEDAAYGQGDAICEVCGAVMETWTGCEPIYSLVEESR